MTTEEELAELQRTPGKLDELFQQAGSLLFWGGMAAVVAAIAYAGWTAAPAAASIIAGSSPLPTSPHHCSHGVVVR